MLRTLKPAEVGLLRLRAKGEAWGGASSAPSPHLALEMPQSPGEIRSLLPKGRCGLEITQFVGVAAPSPSTSWLCSPGCEPSPQKSGSDRASCEFKDGVKGESKVCIWLSFHGFTEQAVGRQHPDVQRDHGLRGFRQLEEFAAHWCSREPRMARVPRFGPRSRGRAEYIKLLHSEQGEGLGSGGGEASGAERQKMNTRSRFSAENVSERLSGLGPEPSLPALHPKRKARILDRNVPSLPPTPTPAPGD